MSGVSAAGAGKDAVPVKYNEAQLRQEFLDRFFEALGWDICNQNGVSPEYGDAVFLLGGTEQKAQHPYLLKLHKLYNCLGEKSYDH